MSERLPLAKDLFANRPEFSDVMQQFPRCQPIIPYVRTPPPGLTVEQVLAHLQSEASAYPERHHQLAAIRYYLHFMIWECEHRWNSVAKGVTNYKTLLDQIERWRRPNEQVCLVTFNYDRMLEGALPVVGVEIKGLPDYVANTRYKLIKLHGSVNWGHEIEGPESEWRQMNAWLLGNELINRLPKPTDRLHIVQHNPISTLGDLVLFPALAIPVQSKQEFECPLEHLDALRAFIPQTTKLLLIGWRAMEGHFLKMLAEGIKHKLRVMAVSGSLDWAKESVANLRAGGIDVDAVESENGFTDFIVNREGDDFLSS